jgi:ribonuclease P protein component
LIVATSVVGRSAFLALRKDGTRFRSRTVRLVYRATDGDFRVAFAIGRSFGHAVERNRVRRRLRHAVDESVRMFTEQPGAGPPTGDALLSASRRALDLPFDELVTELTGLLERTRSQASLG